MSTPALIKRVESARGPDRELDAIIWCALEHPDRTPSKNFFYTRDEWGFFRTNQPEPGTTFYDAPHFTSSLDAAVSLAKRVLEPGDAITIGLNIHHRQWSASVNRLDPDGRPYSVAWGQSPEDFPALALVLAVLRAVKQ